MIKAGRVAPSNSQNRPEASTSFCSNLIQTTVTPHMSPSQALFAISLLFPFLLLYPVSEVPSTVSVHGSSQVIFIVLAYQSRPFSCSHIQPFRASIRHELLNFLLSRSSNNSRHARKSCYPVFEGGEDLIRHQMLKASGAIDFP